jgi:glycosyltransferase involved in cell wall biosynthesis
MSENKKSVSRTLENKKTYEKLLSFAVPCYNSQDYMRRCIDSLLVAGEDTEIIIVDDGSTDDTAKIADEYAEKYPHVCRAVHKENGGHGDAVNTGLELARGKYYKVFDSDDWADEEALRAVMDRLRSFEKKKISVDVLFTNYIYEHPDVDKRKKINYYRILPKNQFFSWDDFGDFHPPYYILMHSVIYRADLLRQTGMKLPKHTFYVDNIYVYQPLVYVNVMYYMDVDLYRYFIGREDQSVNENKMIAQIDQQIRVTKTMTALYNLYDVREKCGQLGKYMIHYLSMMYAICYIFLIIEGSEISNRKIEKLKAYLKKTMPECYNKITYFSPAFFVNFKKKPFRKLTIKIYRILTKIYKFN